MSTTFQSFWSGTSLSPYEWLCLQSFIRQGHSFKLYSFDSGLCVPPGVNLCNAAEILSKSEFFVYSDGPGRGSPSAFSNLFRYKLLVEKGGWWVDTDVICLSGEIPVYERFFAFQEPTVVNGAVLFFPPNDPIVTECLKEALALGENVQWGETGPFLLTRVLDRLGLLHLAQQAQVCYPLYYTEALDVLRPQMLPAVSERLGNSLFLHLWNEIIRRHGISKKALPPKGSLLRVLVDQNEVRGWDGEYNGEAVENIKGLMEQLQNNSDKHSSELERRNARLEAAYRELERQKNEILSSRSWRVTKYLRVVSDMIKAIPKQSGS
jgi:hypothetical protein